MRMNCRLLSSLEMGSFLLLNQRVLFDGLIADLDPLGAFGIGKQCVADLVWHESLVNVPASAQKNGSVESWLHDAVKCAGFSRVNYSLLSPG